MSRSENLNYQDDKQNIPEKMECEKESLNARQILMEARGKLLKYQRKRFIYHEEIEELYMKYHDQCPDCDVLFIENFQCVDYNKKIFQCRNC